MSAPNWLGLLRWTMSHSDGTSDSSYARMSDEDKEWLERVMKEAVRDDPQRMNEVMTYINGHLQNGTVVTAEEEEMFETNLEDLRDIVEQIDMAQVFVKFGGTDVLVDVIASNLVSHDIQALSAAILATIAQNNFAAQEQLFQKRTVDRLMELFLTTNSFTVATKVLLAISSLSRGHSSAEEYFVTNFAELVVNRCLDSAANNLLSRLFFFFNALVASDSATEQRVKYIATLVMPQTFAAFLSDLSIDARDNLVQLYGSILKGLTTNNTASNDMMNRLESTLSQREEYLSQSSVVEEEDKKVERERIAELRRFMYNLKNKIHNDAATLLRENRSSTSNVDPKSSNEVEEERPTVFLIAPPSLEASSNIP